MSDAPTTSAPTERSFRHTIRRDAGSKVSLEVEVDAERLVRQADRVFERHNQKAKIPGFRPGKAPRAMYERSYGAEHLWAEAAEDLVDQTYREIVELEDLSPLDDPKVELTQLEPGKPMRWSATVTVRPDVTLGDYSAHGATIEPAPPTEAEIEKTIDAMRESHAQLQPVDRPAQTGDIVMVDIDVTVDGKTLPPFARNAHVEAGRTTSIPGLGEAFVGLKSGDSKTAVLEFTSDTGSPELRGKKGTFSIRASQVSEKVLPALDDDFAKTVGVGTVADLRREVKNELAHSAFHEARDTAADKMLEHAVDTASVEVPEVLVKDELEHMLADLKARVREQGITFEQFLLQARKREDEIRAEWKPVAEKRAKSILVLDAIAKKEGVTVSSNELASQVAMTPLAQQDPRALRDPLVLASFARSIRNRKTVDKLIGLESPDAEAELIKKAGGEGTNLHGAAAKPEEPKIIVPEKSNATPEGREALRAMLKK
ncbi:MAG TPA: trigger factor [Candidatus Limnocylindria bacterium]|jgi:trigger factor|nr:trigger factor [Candidatus Limnocylindria bacterium]